MEFQKLFTLPAAQNPLNKSLNNVLFVHTSRIQTLKIRSKDRSNMNFQKMFTLPAAQFLVKQSVKNEFSKIVHTSSRSKSAQRIAQNTLPAAQHPVKTVAFTLPTAQNPVKQSLKNGSSKTVHLSSRSKFSQKNAKL